MHQQTQSPFDHERETSALPAPIDLRAFLPPRPQTISLRPTVRRLDADQGFRDPDTHDHFMETKVPRLDTTEEPARALLKHGPTFRRLDARQRFAAGLRPMQVFTDCGHLAQTPLA